MRNKESPDTFSIQMWADKIKAAHMERVKKAIADGKLDDSDPHDEHRFIDWIKMQADQLGLAGFPQHSLDFIGSFVKAEGKFPRWDTPTRLFEVVQAIAEGRTITMLGTYGPGKTTLATAATWVHMRKNLRQEKHIAYTRLKYARTFTYMEDLRHSAYTKGNGFGAVIREEAAREVLVLDEFQAANLSDRVAQALDDILDMRYSQRRATIIISNLPPDDFRTFCPQRNIDRWKEWGHEVVMQSRSLRKPR